ncbi:MAG: hypothetical protein CVV30_01215 [Methanomicrobiales archaeon HGW-Methanomicrobiales-1]|nr:MAG: hypothetical protein CVV30_01215 [Methanomicrobiales archaeon HGW-Methanomicrobiales-1]
MERWARAARALRKEDLPYGKRLVALAKLHSSEAFYGCDDPLEAAVFSGLMGILRQQEEQEPQACTGQGKERGGVVRDVDP